jgi:hypothetical protein
MDSFFNSAAFGGNHLQEGANVSDKDEDDGTSLKWVSCQGRSDVVLATAKAQSNPKLRDALHDEGLCLQANQGHREIVVKRIRNDTFPEQRLVKCLEEHDTKRLRSFTDQTCDVTAMELSQTKIDHARDLLCSVMGNPTSNPVEIYREYIEHHTTAIVLGLNASGMAYLAKDNELPKTFVVKKIQLTKSDQATIDALRTSLQQETIVRI